MDQQGNVCVYLRTVVIDVLWRHFTWQIYANGRNTSTHKISAAYLLSDGGMCCDG